MKPVLLGCLLACAAVSQVMTEPPPLIKLIRKPGSDNAIIRRYVDGKATVHVLGMTSVTGLAETWYLEIEDTFTHIEETDRATHLAGIPEDPAAPSRTMIAVSRPGWSYRPDQAIRAFAKAHYFYVTVYQIRPGWEGELGEAVRQRRLAFDSINLDRPDIAYQVISGAPSGTYIFLAPMTSLKVLDEAWVRSGHHGEPVPLAAGKGGQRTSNEGELSREHLLFRVEPSISYVSDDFASEDPEFWRPK